MKIKVGQDAPGGKAKATQSIYKKYVGCLNRKQGTQKQHLDGKFSIVGYFSSQKN